MSSRVLRYAKFAEESEVSVDPAPAPAFVVDIASTSVDTPADSQITFEGGIGRGQRTHAPGYYMLEGDVVYAADIHTIGWFLKWALGGYRFTPELGGPDTLNLHEFHGSADTVLPSFTTWLGKDIFEQVVRGGMVSQLQLQVSDGYAQLTVGGIYAKDGKGVLDEEVLGKLPLPPPITFPKMRMWVGGTGVGDERSKKITDLTITVNNNGDGAAARGLGSRFPQRAIPAGQRETTVAFTTWYDSTEHIERVWGSPTGPSEDGSTETSLRIAADSGDDGGLVIDLPRVLFTGVQTQPTGRARIDQSVSAKALLDTVTLEDASTVDTEIYARLENDRGELLAVAP